MSSNNQRFQGCCPYTPIPKPPKQRCICPPGRRGPQGLQGPQGPQGPQGEPGTSDPQSAFRAIKEISQFVEGGFNDVDFPIQQFDLNEEYEPNTSTFIPKQDGVYNIIANITFIPAQVPSIFGIKINIRVNGNIIADYVSNQSTVNMVFTTESFRVSTIYQLLAGESVTIDIENSIAGEILGGDRAHFEAARFPSPA